MEWTPRWGRSVRRPITRWWDDVESQAGEMGKAYIQRWTDVGRSWCKNMNFLYLNEMKNFFTLKNNRIFIIISFLCENKTVTLFSYKKYIGTGTSNTLLFFYEDSETLASDFVCSISWINENKVACYWYLIYFFVL